METKALLLPFKQREEGKGPRRQPSSRRVPCTVCCGAGAGGGLDLLEGLVGLDHFCQNFLSYTLVTKSLLLPAICQSKGCGLWLHNRS